MEFNTVINDSAKFLIYSNAKHRLERDIFSTLLMYGIIPADFESSTFVVENDGDGVPYEWQVNLQKLLFGLAHVNVVLTPLEG